MSVTIQFFGAQRFGGKEKQFLFSCRGLTSSDWIVKKWITKWTDRKDLKAHPQYAADTTLLPSARDIEQRGVKVTNRVWKTKDLKLKTVPTTFEVIKTGERPL